MENYLVPGYYLEQAAARQREIPAKNEMNKKAQELLSIMDTLGHQCAIKTDADACLLSKAARECAQLFQRSSSCVEGRNAQLALRHQGIHRLGKNHLKALTVVHSYYIKRRDGTTAAERFFEARHKDLFEFLLENMDYPVRPKNHFKIAA